MTLNCKHCPTEFKSLDLRPEVALKECCDRLISHVAKEHRTAVKKGSDNIRKGTQFVIWLSMMEEHAAIPNTETYIQEEVEKYRVALMKIIGVAVAEEERGVVV